MGVSIPTLIGQLIPLALMLVVFVVGLRLLLAATRLMNRKADVLEQDLEARRESRRGSN